MSDERKEAPLDRCDTLDLLEEAALFRGTLEVSLRSGERFRDTVRAVPTEAGRDYVDFEGRGRVAVDDIEWCSRAHPPAGVIRGESWPRGGQDLR